MSEHVTGLGKGLDQLRTRLITATSALPSTVTMSTNDTCVYALASRFRAARTLSTLVPLIDESTQVFEDIRGNGMWKALQDSGLLEMLTARLAKPDDDHVRDHSQKFIHGEPFAYL